jgi:hypothetical protein
MYRKARVARFENSEADPLETLILFAETLIPLPPFEVWHRDLRTNPDAHLRDLNESAEAPTAAAPSTVEVRSMRYAGAPWWAQLKSFREGPVWRGYIAFHDRASGQVYRTTTIFRENDPTDRRERFLSLEEAALMAFLRFTLP